MQAELIDRPTPLPSGIAGWVKTFRAGMMEMAGVAEEDRGDIADAVERRVSGGLRQADGSMYADYVRLRFTMNKPE